MSAADSTRLPARERDWSRLLTGRLGRPLEIHDHLTSSMDRLAELAEAGAPEGTLVVADRQRRGRGRKGRVWQGAPGMSLLCALLLRPRWSTEIAGVLSLGTGLALVRAARDFNCELAVKWPNDVLHRGRKLAGVLTEARLAAAGYRHLVLGFGVNVHQTEAEFPAEIRMTATSLDLAAGRRLDRGAVLAAWLRELETMTRALDADRHGEILDAWREVWPHRGRAAVDEAGRKVTLLDVGDRGEMLVDTPAGPERVIAGDLSLTPERR